MGWGWEGARFKARRVPPRLFASFLFYFIILFSPGAGADLLGLPWHWPDCSFPSPSAAFRLAAKPSGTALLPRGLEGSEEPPSPRRERMLRAFCLAAPSPPSQLRWPHRCHPWLCHAATSSRGLLLPCWGGRSGAARPHQPPPLGSGESKLIHEAREGSCEFRCLVSRGLFGCAAPPQLMQTLWGGVWQHPKPRCHLGTGDIHRELGPGG